VAVKIRLKRMGKIRAPYYRIVVADSRTKRDGRVIEEIGKYHPKENPSLIEVNSDRALYWLGVGAQPSEPVAAILRVTGDWQRFNNEPAPPPMLVAEEKRDKTSRFNEALKDSRFEPTSDAISEKRPSRRAEQVSPSTGTKTADATTAGATTAGASTAGSSGGPSDGTAVAIASDSSAPDATTTETPASEVPAPDDAAAGSDAAAADDQPAGEESATEGSAVNDESVASDESAATSETAPPATEAAES